MDIQHLVLDGAPLVSAGKLLTTLMTRQYLEITHKAQKRDPKTLERFQKTFLPERYLDSFLKIADHMSDQTIRNIVIAASRNQISKPAKRFGEGILYLYGTAMNELLSKKSAKALNCYAPKAQLLCNRGDAHCRKAIFEPEKWIQIVESFLERNVGCV